MMGDKLESILDSQKTCVGGYTCLQCGCFVLMNATHACTDTSGITSIAIEPPLPSLEFLMKQIGHTGHHVFVRYDPEREFNHWTVMIASRQGRCDTDAPVKTLVKMWNELQEEKT